MSDARRMESSGKRFWIEFVIGWAVVIVIVHASFQHPQPKHEECDRACHVVSN